ncbi:MAG: hypothetical protein WCT19_04700 [Candidatus Paceibacterota bacterium]
MTEKIRGSVFEQYKKEFDKEPLKHETLDFSDITKKKQKNPDKSWEETFSQVLNKEKADISLGYGIHLMYKDNLVTPENHFDKYDGPFMKFPNSIMGNLTVAKEWNASLTDLIDRSAKLRRLTDIKQLGYLSFPEADQTEWPGTDFNLEKFLHSRYDHSVLTAIMNLVILRISKAEGFTKCSEKDILKSFISSIMHDSATVAGGDATKKVSPQELDEEKLVKTILQSEEINNLFQGIKFNEKDNEDIQNIIFNEGPFGKLLDITDKLAYTSRDFEEITSLLKTNKYSSPESEELLAVAKEKPQIYDIAFDLRFDDDKGVFCTNPKRLGEALKIRALMHNYIYLNPQAQIVEAAVIYPALTKLLKSGDKKISVENLLSQSDSYFEKVLCEALGDTEPFPNVIKSIRQIIKNKDIKVDVYSDRPSAEAAVADLKQNGRHICNVIDKTKGIKTGTGILVEKENKLIPFKEGYPDKDKEIQEIADRIKTVRIYHSNEPIV